MACLVRSHRSTESAFLQKRMAADGRLWRLLATGLFATPPQGTFSTRSGPPSLAAQSQRGRAVAALDSAAAKERAPYLDVAVGPKRRPPALCFLSHGVWRL